MTTLRNEDRQPGCLGALWGLVMVLLRLAFAIIFGPVVVLAKPISLLLRWPGLYRKVSAGYAEVITKHHSLKE